MTTGLADIFEGIQPPLGGSSDKPLYAVMPVPGHSSYFVGKDRESLAVPPGFNKLITEEGHILQSGFPVSTLQFELHCHLKRAQEPGREGTFTVIRCRDADHEVTRYFLYVCEMMVRVLRDRPTRTQIA